MKKFICSFLLFTLSLLTLHFALLTSVGAHILKTDGSIGVVLHISPDDDPVVEEPAHFFFEIKDTEGKFTENSCNCTATVFENGQKIIAQSISDSTFTYTFPQKGLYTITLSGSPLNGNSFQPFTLSYDVLVSHEPEGTSSEVTNTMIELLVTPKTVTLGAIIATIATIISMWPIRRRMKKGKYL